VRALVAGVGNVFLGDDGFGVEVVRSLVGATLPAGVRVQDYGIRGLHLAYDLLDAPDLLVVVDITSRGGAPGTLYVLEPDPDAIERTLADGHGMDLGAVFAQVRQLGGRLPRTRILGCEPATVAEGIGLSEPVRRAIEPAVALVFDVLYRELAHAEEVSA